MFEDEPVEPPQATPTIEEKPSRQYQESKVIPYPAIRELLNRIVDPHDKWLIGTTYANGNRISETLALKYGDFNWDNDFLYIQSIVKKKRGRKVKGKAKQSPKPPKRRNFPIPREIEAWLTEDIIKFVEQGRKETPDLLVWPKCKKTAQNHIKKITGNKAHSLRHSRATHLINVFGFTIREVGTAFDIADRSLAEWIAIYGHLERNHLVNKWNSIKKVPDEGPSFKIEEEDTVF
jgi:integrase